MSRASWKKLMINHLELTRQAINVNMSRQGYPQVHKKDIVKIEDANQFSDELRNFIKFPDLAYLNRKNEKIDP